MSSSDRVTPRKELFRLLRLGLETAKRVQSIAGTFGESIKAAVESKHLHSGAFGLVNRLTKMDEAKRIDFLASFDAYRAHCEAAGGPWSSGHYGDFVKQAEEAEARELAKDAELRRQREVDESVERVRTGIKPLDGGDAPEAAAEPATPPAKLAAKPSGKVTSLDKVRARKADREAAKAERQGKRGKARSAGEVSAAADAAEAAAAEGSGNDPGGVEAEPEGGEPGRRYDAQGNTLPPDISGEWEVPATPPDEPIGMPGAEDAGSVH